MPRWFLIRIDVQRVAAHLGREDGRPRNADDVYRLLVDSGLRPADGGWLCHEADLGLLKPEEIFEASLFADDPAPPASPGSSPEHA